MFTEKTLFTKLSPEESGIHFRNEIKDDSIFNEASYRNIYNGGGVAIGDINNDGLADIFMTANQGKNRLFLNQGNMKFLDITDSSGIVKTQKWSTGVTMADVNSDGLLDIYICAAGENPKDARKNALYINCGNLKFNEEAAKFNLEDKGGYHTQASFFDYDLDGDLDVYLLNNDHRVSTGVFPMSSVRSFRSREGGDRLMENRDGHFFDVSEKAGIYGSNMGLGLGVSVGDINGDHWPDIYVSNDFFEKDYLYINQQDGTFLESSDSLIDHMSQSSMGADIADINNDGYMDIFSTDMLPEDEYRLKKNTRFDTYDIYNLKMKYGYHKQVMGNMLQLNNGDNTFSEIARFAGVNATDWSWGALVFDLDNDGWKDIFVCNGMFLDITDNDFVDFFANDSRENFFKNSKKMSDYELLKTVGISTPISNYAFINQRNLSFKNKALEMGLGEAGFSNGAAYADLDNDGDLDLVINNINSECSVYRNNSREFNGNNFLTIQLDGGAENKFGIGALVSVYADGKMQTQENFPSRGFQSSVEPIMNFGLGNTKRIDSLLVVWPNLKSQCMEEVAVNQQITLKQRDATIPIESRKPEGEKLFKDITDKIVTGDIGSKENEFIDFDRERLMPHMLSMEGPKCVIGDINGDGLMDFIVGAPKRQVTKVFIQDMNGNFRPSEKQISLEEDAQYEDADLELLDFDNDGDLDLIVASGGNMDKKDSPLLQVRLYKNNRYGIFDRDETALSSMNTNASCVSVGDFDEDGDMDIFIGGRSVPGEYGHTPRSYLLRNDNGIFNDITDSVEGLRDVGMVTDAEWKDFDNDGKPDLLIVGEWMPITLYKNTDKGFIKTPVLNDQFKFSNGWWNCVKAVDLDQDGDMDFIAGNLGLNSRIKGDREYPVNLYVSDFDGNGTKECVLTLTKENGKKYPFPLKPDMVAQMPILNKKFLKHEAYAGMTIEEVFDKQTLDKAIKKDAYEFSTSMFINDGKGNFERVSLPTQAQLSPIYCVEISDLDGDHKNDLFLGGNFNGVKPEIGRYDASHGIYFKGIGDNKFEYVPPKKSGLMIKGQVRNIKKMDIGINGKILLVTKSDENLQVFKVHYPKTNNRL